MKAVIIDDELDAIKSLSIMAKEYCSIEVAGTAQTALEGIKLINNLSPDIVFLDVEMPNGSGFDLLESIPNRNFHLVFTTAYEHHAIQAIKSNAVDYLMKPVDIDELIQAYENIREKESNDPSEDVNNSGQRAQKEQLTKIPIAIKNEYLMMDLEDIQFIKSDGSYSIIHTFDENYTTAKNLKHYENLLSHEGFLRVSNSHIINLEKINKYIREDGGMVELQNKTKIAIARNRKTELKQKLGI